MTTKHYADIEGLTGKTGNSGKTIDLLLMARIEGCFFR